MQKLEMNTVAQGTSRSFSVVEMEESVLISFIDKPFNIIEQKYKYVRGSEQDSLYYSIL